MSFINSVISTQETTKKPKNINEMYDFCKKKYMQDYINQYCPQFNEQFELLDYVNRGSTGYVYGIKSKIGNNRKYAVKFCIKKNREEKEDKNKYQEISIQKKLHHKNVNQILAFIKMKEGSYFSISENGKHGDMINFLYKLLKKNTLSETCLLYFAKQILDSLEYINRCKIVHMDVKPSNILLDSELNPKIIDFSASCSFADFSPEDVVKFPFIGTGKFIAPEIIKKTHLKVKYAEKIDIYSLGVTLYYLYFGIYPYNLNNIDNHDYTSISKQIEKENLEFPKDYNASNMLKDFLTKLLEKDYMKRLTIKEALNHSWIQGWQILEDEKLNIACLESFLINMVTDNIYKFNRFQKNQTNFF